MKGYWGEEKPVFLLDRSLIKYIFIVKASWKFIIFLLTLQYLILLQPIFLDGYEFHSIDYP